MVVVKGFFAVVTFSILLVVGFTVEGIRELKENAVVSFKKPQHFLHNNNNNNPAAAGWMGGTLGDKSRTSTDQLNYGHSFFSFGKGFGYGFHFGMPGHEGKGEDKDDCPPSSDGGKHPKDNTHNGGKGGGGKKKHKDQGNHGAGGGGKGKDIGDGGHDCGFGGLGGGIGGIGGGFGGGIGGGIGGRIGGGEFGAGAGEGNGGKGR